MDSLWSSGPGGATTGEYDAIVDNADLRRPMGGAVKVSPEAAACNPAKPVQAGGGLARAVVIPAQTWPMGGEPIPPPPPLDGTGHKRAAVALRAAIAELFALSCKTGVDISKSVKEKRAAALEHDRMAAQWEADRLAVDSTPTPSPSPLPTFAPAPSAPSLPPMAKRPGNGPMSERYRPQRLDEVRGQPTAVRRLKAFAANPSPRAFVLSGGTGSGKSSAAMALAAELGCDVAQGEFGGVYSIASGDQGIDGVRESFGRLHTTPMMGSGYRVLIVNEADKMSAAAEGAWLDRLENIPPRSVILFTTNFGEKLSQRFLDRCTHLKFVSDAARIGDDARALVAQVWAAESGAVPPAAEVDAVMSAAVVDSQVSFRRVMAIIEERLLAA